jgi:1-acyl-sn-glycerol-3-phosphate acyltransferase
VGIHPEGTRGKGPDPYEFLPVRPGLGQLVAEAPPNVVVVPFFILGLDNSTTHQIRRNFLPGGKRGSNVRIWFGEAMTASDLRNVGNPQQITDHVFARIARMAEADRASHPDEDSVRGALSG